LEPERSRGTAVKIARRNLAVPQIVSPANDIHQHGSSEGICQLSN
jgi:hypothetical protein